jgi:prepilin-type N-terminal cleavage/methylation domain-containing protein
MARKAAKRPSAGFTLVELLVVIAIIALLVTILAPSLGRARELARHVVCLSQMRAIYLAEALYAEGNYTFIAGHDAADYWPHYVFDPAPPWPWAGTGHWVHDYVPAPDVWFCPSADARYKAQAIPEIVDPSSYPKAAMVTYSIPHYSGMDIFPELPQPSRSPFQKGGLDPDLRTKIWTNDAIYTPLLTETCKFRNRMSLDGELFHEGGVNVLRRSGEGLFFRDAALPLD